MPSSPISVGVFNTPAGTVLTGLSYGIPEAEKFEYPEPADDLKATYLAICGPYPRGCVVSPETKLVYTLALDNLAGIGMFAIWSVTVSQYCGPGWK